MTEIKKEIEIKKIEMDNVVINSEAIGVFLFQISNEIDESQKIKKIKNPNKQYKKIKKLIIKATKEHTNNGHSFSFFIFPEVSMPYAHLNNLIKFVKKNSQSIL